jgi:acetylglutamate kinase
MIDLFRAAEYARLHRDRLMVFKVGGACLERPKHAEALARQISVVVSFGVRALVVHGGGPQTAELQGLFGETPRTIDGRRVTSETGLRALTLATAGEINTRLAARITASGAPAIGICAASADIVTARRRPPVETSEGLVDFGLVGDVESLSVAPLVALCHAGYVPVLCPPASDGQGGYLNVNADVLAAEVAVAAGAAKLVLLTDVPGVLRSPGDPQSLVSALTLAELERLNEEGSLQKGMKVKAAAIRRALTGGVARVHVVSGTEPEALLGELYTTQGTGTLLTLAPEEAPVPEVPCEP